MPPVFLVLCSTVNQLVQQLHNGLMTTASIEQDRAAGSVERRRLRTRSGEVFTASIAMNNTSSPFRLTLRFKNGGTTIQKPIGTVEGATRFDALKAGWHQIRADNFIEQFGWSWVSE